MGIFDYNCYIENKNCSLSKSKGQEFTSGWIYAVNKKLTKKLPCYYSGYGYATLDYHSNDKIHDLIYLSYGGTKDNINDKTSFFACPDCAEFIENECNYWKDFFDSVEEIKENIEIYKEKIKKLMNEKDRLVNNIYKTKLLLEKEKEKLEKENKCN